VGLMGHRCEIPGISAHTVRDVAPRKLMLCLSFKLPPAAAFEGKEGGGERDTKRARTEDTGE
jgi:hypothetical protein